MTEQNPPGQPTPPEEPSSTRKPWVIGVAVVLVLALVGGAVVAALTVFGKTEHTIAITNTAGGMKRDSDTETTMQEQLDAAEKTFNKGKNIAYVKSAVYQQADSKKGPEGSVLFLGAKLKKAQKPSTWINDKFIEPASSNGLKIKRISAGDAGGTAACAYTETGQKNAICAWATEDSIGEVVPVVSGYTYQQVADLMKGVRKDVETTS